MAESFLIDGVNLVGWDIVKVGVRQAWPFVTFGSPGDRVERRLFIDTDFWVRDATGAEVKSGPLARLESLVMLLVAEVGHQPAGLSIQFDDGSQLTISNEANATTTHAPWWL